MCRKHKEVSWIIAVSLILVLTAGIASAATETNYISFSGNLTNSVGAPLTGTYTVIFRLYNVSFGGTELANDTHPVWANKGQYTTTLNFPASLYNGQQLYVGIKKGSDPEKTPRTVLYPVPYALSLRPGATISGSDAGVDVLKVSKANAGSGINISTSGTNSPAVFATVKGPNSPAIYAEPSSSCGGCNAVVGRTRADGPAALAGIASGVNSYGVYGDSARSYGIYGTSLLGTGVYGIGKQGGYFTTNSGGSSGVNVTTTFASTPGIKILTKGTGSHGVYASTTGSGSSGVYAKSAYTNTPAIYAQSTGQNSPAVRAVTTCPGCNAVVGSTSADGPAAIAGLTTGKGSYGVYGSTTNSSAHALYGTTTGSGSFAVYAHTTYDNTEAIHAVAEGIDSTGIVGVSKSTYGIYGTGPIAGVYGISSNYGLYGATNKDDQKYGVYTPDRMRALAYDTLAGDVAEFMPVSGDLPPGTVVVIGDDGKLRKSDTAYDTKVAGIISTEPGVALGTKESGNPGEAQIAIAGRVPCRVDATKAPIHAGDLLTTSDNPGHAMKAEPDIVNSHKYYPDGSILGKAMGSLDSGTGTIDVLVTLQ